MLERNGKRRKKAVTAFSRKLVPVLLQVMTTASRSTGTGSYRTADRLRCPCEVIGSSSWAEAWGSAQESLSPPRLVACPWPWAANPLQTEDQPPRERPSARQGVRVLGSDLA
jgi:hypothetical protein